jgi:hypothetical protein
MARIVLGVATSHSPMFALPPGLWERFASLDHLNKELIFPPDGWNMSYEEALDGYVSEEIRHKPRTLEVFTEQARQCAEALDQLGATLRAAKPDLTVIISDDQDEWFFENNMPMFSVYWGDSVRMVPRKHSKGHDAEITKLIADGYGDVPLEVPVRADVGRHVIEFLADREFDVSQFNYAEESHGGRITRRLPRQQGEVELDRVTPVREQGLPHGFAFIIKRLYENVPAPILPVFLNTCYPPNAVRPKRAYDFGQALGDSIAAWDEDITVAIVASGGLSHFVLDEEIDRQLLGALQKKDEEALRGLPRGRLSSATSESLNWVALGGALANSELEMDLVDYVPISRSEVGTGGGWAFARWTTS